MRLLGRCVLVTILLIGLQWGAGALGTALTGVTDAQLEDQPGWDCATQGNRVCGDTP